MTQRKKIFGMVTMQRSWEYTSYALKSFARNTKLSEGDIFCLIDNDRSFGSPPSWVIPTLNMLTNEQPKSFAANVNQVLEIARLHQGDLYFVNNDIIFTPGWNDPLVAIEEPSILSPLSNREVQYEVEGFVWKNVLTLADYISKGHLLRDVLKLHKTQCSGLRPVISLPFFCVKIPFEVYSAVGDLDESFGRGGAEDNDYCLRAIAAGFKVEYVMDSYVLHFSGKSTWAGAETQSETAQRVEQYEKIFAEKWGESLCRLIIKGDMTVLNAVPEAHQAAAQGDFKRVVEVLKG